MLVKNNYDECLTNVACSIRKYFDLEYHHKTIPYIDELLDKKKPNNVILILLDGMGANILERTLDENSFFRKHLYKKITTVFPATTTAATTSITTGLNPVEHGFLGWNMYVKPIDKTITLFLECEKGEIGKCSEFEKVKDKFHTKPITKEIKEIGKYCALSLFPFSAGESKVYKDINEMCDLIINEAQKDGKKFIYAYNDEPDHTMHETGPDSHIVKRLIQDRNYLIKRMCDSLKDALIIVVADHGHIKVDNIKLNDYPEIYNMLERTTSIEQRAVSFKIKDEFKSVFPSKFNELFGKWFKLYDREEIIESKLFGDGDVNELFEDALGDYIAIAESSNKCILTKGDDELVSQHAGYTDDEIYVPLIIIEK